MGWLFRLHCSHRERPSPPTSKEKGSSRQRHKILSADSTSLRASGLLCTYTHNWKIPGVCLHICRQTNIESWCVCQSLSDAVGDKKKSVRPEICLRGLRSYWRDATWIQEGSLGLHKEMLWCDGKNMGQERDPSSAWVCHPLSCLGNSCFLRSQLHFYLFLCSEFLDDFTRTKVSAAAEK